MIPEHFGTLLCDLVHSALRRRATATILVLVGDLMYSLPKYIY